MVRPAPKGDPVITEWEVENELRLCTEWSYDRPDGPWAYYSGHCQEDGKGPHDKILYWKNGRVIGQMRFDTIHPFDYGGGCVVTYLIVDIKFRRQGIATAMLNCFLDKITSHVRVDRRRTELGKLWCVHANKLIAERKNHEQKQERQSSA